MKSRRIIDMSNSAISVLVFAIYMFMLGLVLLVVPNLILSVFGFPTTSEVWIRVVGMLVTILGYYYSQAARNELKPFIRASVYGRCSVFVFFVVFVLLKFAPPMLILFGVIDVAGAIWTAVCLGKETS
jgi:hypothetical protein